MNMIESRQYSVSVVNAVETSERKIGDNRPGLSKNIDKN